MNCERCPYGRYPRIPPTPIMESDIAIVGEAPGTTELAKKKPFVGPSGKLLGQVFTAAQLPPKTRIFVTNALLCRPPSGKPILKEAVEICRARLLNEIEQVKPKLIISFGATALHALTGDYKLKITACQGRVFWLGDIPIVAVVHPALVLRKPGAYKSFYAAVKYAVDVYKGGKIKDPGQTQFEVIKDASRVPGVIDFLKQFPELTCDIETTGLNPMIHHPFLLGTSWEKNKVLIFETDMIPLLKNLFEDTRVKFVWQNGKFDTSFLRMMDIQARIDHDVLLEHYCLNENGPHDLDQLAVTYLGAEAYKDVMSKYKKVGYDKAPREVVYPYLAKDCDYTGQLHRLFLPQVEADPDLRKLYYELLLPAARFLRGVQFNGIYPDVEYINQLEAELTQKRDQLIKEIQDEVADLWDPDLYMEETGAKTADEKIKPTSTQQLAWLIIDRLGLRPQGGKTPRSLDKDALASIMEEHPVIPKIAELRKTIKMLSTYVKGIKEKIDPDGRVRTTFLLHGTVTGRLSSRRPNLQNIPGDPKIRGIFCAAPGNVLIEADYKAAELRVLAHLSDEDFLINCFKEGRDLHTEVAVAIFGEEFKHSREHRLRAKAVNFGIAYGRTEYSLAEEFKIPVEEARQMIDDWFKRMPKAERYLKSCDEAARRGEVLTTPFGRKRRFGLISAETLDALENEARNFRIQSIASDLTLMAAMELDSKLKEFGAKIINLVHDSILIEAPDDEQKVVEICKLVHETMVRVPAEKLGDKVPFEAELKVGKRWGSLQEIAIIDNKIQYIEKD